MAACTWRAFDSRLIEVVHSKPILYNTRLKEFRNKSMKENAWNKTADEMNSTFYFDVR